MVIVVSEETALISVVTNGEMVSDLDAARLRVVLREALSDAPEPEVENEESLDAQLPDDSDGVGANARSSDESATVDKTGASLSASNSGPQARSAS